jgi:hypothetical protein
MNERAAPLAIPTKTRVIPSGVEGPFSSRCKRAALILYFHRSACLPGRRTNSKGGGETPGDGGQERRGRPLRRSQISSLRPIQSRVIPSGVEGSAFCACHAFDSIAFWFDVLHLTTFRREFFANHPVLFRQEDQVFSRRSTGSLKRGVLGHERNAKLPVRG